MPNAAPLSLTSAGWLLWVIGLLQVFFSPPEAIITLILGTALSLEAFTRSRNTIWIPAIILNVFTAALEIAWMLSLPSHVLLLTLAILIALMGAWHERKSPRIGRIIALTCAPITLVITTLQPDTLSLTGMLALMFGFAVRYRQASLMYISYGLAGVLLTPLLPLHLPYAQIGIALLVESTVMAGAAIGIEVIVAREEIRWWTRSVFQLGMILIVFSFAFALVMPAYGLLAMGAGAPLVAIIPSLLIVAWCVLAYRQTGRALLLAASILPLLLICSLMLPTLPQTLTIGLVLFVVARRMNSPYFVLIEYAGVVSILLAAVAGMDFGQWDASENLLSVLYVVTLVCYGYVGGRRIPFAIGTGVFVVAGLFAVGKINGWFVPLIGGGVLIGAAVFMESQRAATEHITLMVRSRWQTWK